MLRFRLPHGIVDLNTKLQGAEIRPYDRRRITPVGGRAHLLQALRGVDLVEGRADPDLDFRQRKCRAFEIRAVEPRRKSGQRNASEDRS